jgi:hypothetical protein
MIPTPTPIGLFLCDYVLVEEGTKKISLIGTFEEAHPASFPAVLPPFFVYAALTDGVGRGTLELVFSRLETDEDVFSYRKQISLRDQLSVLHVKLRVRNCPIPASGVYQFALLVDGMLVAQRQLRVYSKGDSQ